jgi:hypothetical protein
MDISSYLTQKKLMEILEASIIKGQEEDDIQINQFIEEIKEKVLSVVGIED